MIDEWLEFPDSAFMHGMKHFLNVSYFPGT